MRWTALLLGVACCASATARADYEEPATEAATPEESTGTIDVRTPAPEPAVARSYHVHDGFYARAGIGTGPHWLKIDPDAGPSLSANGFDVALDLQIGGSPSPGLTLGGALLLNVMPSAELEADGRRSNVDPDVGLGLLGFFVDGFPDPRKGFHVGGTAGLATVTFSELGTNGESEEARGFGGAVWAGYDFWVGDEWSIGPALRFSTTITKTSEDAGDATVTTRGLTLLLTALYH